MRFLNLIIRNETVTAAAGPDQHSQNLKANRSPLFAQVRQRGVTLVVSMIFLVLLTLLGITAMNTTSLQEKMAGNTRDLDVALQAAESALRKGEGYLAGLASNGLAPPPAAAGGSSGYWPINTAQVWDDTWWNANSIAYGGGLDPAVQDPRFVVEEDQQYKWNPTLPPHYIHYYHITSRAHGTTTASQVMLEGTFRIGGN